MRRTSQGRRQRAQKRRCARLTLGLAAFVSEFGITAAIAELRPLAFGPQPDSAALQRFGQLHRAAVALFTAIGAGTVALALLHAAADVRERPAP